MLYSSGLHYYLLYSWIPSSSSFSSLFDCQRANIYLLKFQFDDSGCWLGQSVLMDCQCNVVDIVMLYVMFHAIYVHKYNMYVNCRRIAINFSTRANEKELNLEKIIKINIKFRLKGIQPNPLISPSDMGKMLN